MGKLYVRFVRRTEASSSLGASSDPTAMKPANKTEQSVAEPVERRAGTKGNVDQQSTRRTQSRISVSQALERIRKVQNALPSHTRGGSRMRESRMYGCVSSEGWRVQQEVDLPGQESGAP